MAARIWVRITKFYVQLSRHNTDVVTPRGVQFRGVKIILLIGWCASRWWYPFVKTGTFLYGSLNGQDLAGGNIWWLLFWAIQLCLTICSPSWGIYQTNLWQKLLHPKRNRFYLLILELGIVSFWTGLSPLFPVPWGSYWCVTPHFSTLACLGTFLEDRDLSKQERSEF